MPPPPLQLGGGGLRRHDPLAAGLAAAVLQTKLLSAAPPPPPAPAQLGRLLLTVLAAYAVGAVGRWLVEQHRSGRLGRAMLRSMLRWRKAMPRWCNVGAAVEPPAGPWRSAGGSSSSLPG